jgi:hypothetical protein
MTNTLRKVEARYAKGIENYAAAERTDPFAMARAIAHHKIGLDRSAHRDGGGNNYDATPTVEHREYIDKSGETVRYTVPAYKNVQRP